MSIQQQALKAGRDFLEQSGYKATGSVMRLNEQTEQYYTVVYFTKEAKDRTYLSALLPNGSVERMPDVLTKAAVGLKKKRGKKARPEVLGPENDAE